MEIWKDYQSGKYFALDPLGGRQSPSNRYGKEKKQFYPYEAGFSHNLKPKLHPFQKALAVQPKKFDGYFQFPRPYEKTSIKQPYNRNSSYSPKHTRILDESKIPHPLEFLSTSDICLKTKISQKSLKNKSVSLQETMFKTIDELKKPQDTSILLVKTAMNLQTKKINEAKFFNKGYIWHQSKEERRKLKGYFLSQFKTSAELFQIEKGVRERTNPIFVIKREKFKRFERKMLERKRKATMLIFLTKNY